MNDNLKILLIEDNPGDRMLISESLVSLKPLIDSVQSGREAFRELEKNHYDIILIDYSLPSSNGLEVLNLLSEKGVDIPVILITGQGEEHIAAESIKRGAHDYVIKTELSRLVFSISSGIERFKEKQEHKKAEEELKKTEQKLTIQYKIASIFLTVSDEEMYHEVLKVVLEAMESDCGVFGYIDEKGDLVCPSLTGDVRGLCQMTGKEIVFPKRTGSNTIWCNALKNKKGSLSNIQFSVPEGHIPINKALIVPIIYRNETIGILMLANKVSDYTAADRKLLETIAKQVAPVLHSRLGKGRKEKERKHLEEQLIQSQKMESIGRLAGGIAHDFNNILTAIIGNADLSLLSLTEGDPLYEELNEIKIGAERAANLTSQLLAFSRRQIIAPRILNLNTLLLRIDNMLRRLIGEDIELVMVPDDDLWKILVDQGQIEQILTNLVVNARDAMPGGGKITIETANKVFDDEYVNLQTKVVSGDYVMLAVTDTGIGMDEETMQHIFEPFFTTKEINKGTGLGLSTCYGIVKQNNGYIWADSESGKGASFTVYFPKTSGKKETKPENNSLGELPKGTETVFVVEDEITVCRMVVRTLEKCGYTVFSASNGEEGVSVAEQYDKNIHLLITDVVMPKMGGKELSVIIKDAYPEAKILFMSGYTDSEIVHRGILDNNLDFIQKPFSPVVIARKVRQVLDGKV